MPTPPPALDARKAAEEQVLVILDLPKPVLALLVYTLGKAGWSQGTAERELRAVKWWL